MRPRIYNITMNPFILLVLGSLLLGACAQLPKPAEPAHAHESAPAHAPHPHVVAEPPLPDVELSRELLYEFLLSEIAQQRGHRSLAVDSSIDLAKKTRDPRVARRAANLAFELGDMEKSIEAFRQWREIQPDAPLATRMLASALLREGRLDEAQIEMAKMLEIEKDRPATGFMQVFQLLSAHPDKTAALRMMRDLAQPYAQVAESHWAVAQLARQADDNALALSAVREARSLRPAWDMAVSLEAQLLHKDAPQQALEVLRGYLARYPNAREVRLQYARSLLEQKQYRPSRAEFQRLAKELPDNPDMAFAIALISLQLNELRDAEIQLQQALEKGKQDRDTVQYYLGQLNEAKENEKQAIAHYREVKDGEYHFPARLRVTYLLSKRGKLDEALEFLRQTQLTDNRQRAQQITIEAQLLHDAKRSEEAYQVLQQGLEKLPNHPDLLYETAMLADKTGRLEMFEKLMRKLIQVKPDHAHAYNALGYRLLDFKERIPEALDLVEKALQLAPNDAAILDSVGWGYYLSGKLEESEQLLRRALAGNPDPEIAAHLGEVLWVRGSREEAQKTWQDSLKANPGNALLQAVMKRFMP